MQSMLSSTTVSLLGKRAYPDSEKENSSPKRFSFGTDEEVKKFSLGFVPVSTQKNNQWALKTFNCWREERNKVFPPEEHCPDSILTTVKH